jgi:hypothetical protein
MRKLKGNSCRSAAKLLHRLFDYSFEAFSAEAEHIKRIHLGVPRIDVKFEIPSVRRIPPEPVLNFEIAKAPAIRMVSGIDIVSLDRVAAEDELLGYSVETVVRNATLRVLMELPYLHLAVEGLVRGLLTRLGAREEEEIAVDPLKSGLGGDRSSVQESARSLWLSRSNLSTIAVLEASTTAWRDCPARKR